MTEQENNLFCIILVQVILIYAVATVSVVFCLLTGVIAVVDIKNFLSF